MNLAKTPGASEDAQYKKVAPSRKVLQHEATKHNVEYSYSSGSWEW